MTARNAIIIVAEFTLALLFVYWKLDLVHRQDRDCANNLRDIGTALEMYSIDSAGRYPRALGDRCTFQEQDVPLTRLSHYLDSIPSCPTIGAYRLATAVGPDLYTVVCTGRHSYAYTSVKGFIVEKGW